MSDVLVLRRGGLGDTLLMLPTLRVLRRAHPEARLHFAGVREFTDVLAAFGAVDAALSSEDLQTWRLGTTMGGAAAERLRRYAHIVADDPLVARVASETTQVHVFDTTVRGTEPFGLQIARQLGLAPEWPADAWLLPPRLAPEAGPVVLAPGSGGLHKCWPKDRWLALAAGLCEAALRVVVGPAEAERDDPRRWAWPAGTTFLADLTAVELANELRAASAFVGNDSGPTHLAAMLAVPTVALFGPTAAAVWAPVGPHVVVVGGAGRAVEAIDVEALTRTVMAVLAK